MRTLIENVKVITMDPSNLVVDRANILIEDDTVTGILLEIPQDFVADRLLDGRNKLAIPGLINSHTHIGMMSLRGYADDLALDTWLFDKIFPLEDRFTAQDVYWASLLGCAEMIRSGITCFADMYMFMDKVAEACVATGIRADLARGLQCFDKAFDSKTDRRLREAKALYRQWNQALNGRLTVRLGPHAVYTCVPRYIESIVELAHELGVGIHIHLSETRKENSDCMQAYGKTPTAHLADLGLFEHRVTAAHGVHLSSEDLDILASKHVSIIHCPGSNLKLGSGIASIQTLLECGINVGLGTDSAASNNNLNMFEEIYLAAVLQKGMLEDSAVVPAHQALEMATVNGARALGVSERIGALRPGMKADIALIDVDKPHYYPMHDPIAALVYAGQAHDVHTVLVDGQVLYSNGEFTTFDFDEVKWENQRLWKRLFS